MTNSSISGTRHSRRRHWRETPPSSTCVTFSVSMTRRVFVWYEDQFYVGIELAQAEQLAKRHPTRGFLVGLQALATTRARRQQLIAGGDSDEMRAVSARLIAGLRVCERHMDDCNRLYDASLRGEYALPEVELVRTRLSHLVDLETQVRLLGAQQSELLDADEEFERAAGALDAAVEHAEREAEALQDYVPPPLGEPVPLSQSDALRLRDGRLMLGEVALEVTPEVLREHADAINNGLQFRGLWEGSEVWGVFATRAYERDDVVTFFTGELVAHDAALADEPYRVAVSAEVDVRGDRDAGRQLGPAELAAMPAERHWGAGALLRDPMRRAALLEADLPRLQLAAEARERARLDEGVVCT